MSLMSRLVAKVVRTKLPNRTKGRNLERNQIKKGAHTYFGHTRSVCYVVWKVAHYCVAHNLKEYC